MHILFFIKVNLVFYMLCCSHEALCEDSGHSAGCAHQPRPQRGSAVSSQGQARSPGGRMCFPLRFPEPNREDADTLFFLRLQFSLLVKLWTVPRSGGVQGSPGQLADAVHPEAGFPGASGELRSPADGLPVPFQPGLVP